MRSSLLKLKTRSSTKSFTRASTLGTDDKPAHKDSFHLHAHGNTMLQILLCYV